MRNRSRAARRSARVEGLLIGLESAHKSKQSIHLNKQEPHIKNKQLLMFVYVFIWTDRTSIIL